MRSIPLTAFMALGWSDNIKAKLQRLVALGEAEVMYAWLNAGQLSAAAYTSEPDTLPGPVVAVWRKSKDIHAGSRTRQALAMVAAGETPFTAAKAVGINHAAVYRALAKMRQKSS